MTLLRRGLVSGACLLLASALSLVAFADVVMPPPTDCPKGQTGTTSHGGPRCELDPPTDCPAGWHGQLGGTCVLRPCRDDKDCVEDEACVAHSVCLEPFEDRFYDYGEEQEERTSPPPSVTGDILVAARELFAGPPLPRTPRATPITRYKAVNVCAAEVACAAPRTCQTEKLCVPKGKRALAYRGTNVTGARVARKTTKPLTTSDAKPTEHASSAATSTTSAATSTTPVAPPPSAPPKGGCGSCDVGGPAGAQWGGWLVAGLALAVGARRRGSPRRRSVG